MEMLQQIFMAGIAAFVFFILIAKLASAVINGDEDDDQRKVRDFSLAVAKEMFLVKELKSKTEKNSSKSKGKKNVRFAVDDDEFVVNKVVAGPSETKQVVVEKNCDEELIIPNEVGSLVKSPEEGFGGVENQRGRANRVVELSAVSSVSPLVDCLEDDHGNEKADYDDNKAREESTSDGVMDYDQTEEGKNELVDQRSSEGTMIRDSLEANVANVDEDQMCMKLLCDDGIDEDEKEKEGLISDEDDSDDDWEGVERSDLEKVFAMAADYGKVDDHLQSLGSDIQMQLYGLHKVATEGPCHEAQPMALKVSARAKWNAWQKLGNMNPDVAMEQYIILLSEKVPGWSQGMHSVGVDLSSSNTTSLVDTCQKERKTELESCSDGGDLFEVSVSVHEDKL